MDAQLRTLARGVEDPNSRARFYAAQLRAGVFDAGAADAEAVTILWETLGGGEDLRTRLAYNHPDAGRMLWIPPTTPECPALLGIRREPYHFACGFWLAETPVLHDGLPRVNINWHQATAWCQERGLRLPHEIEWEYAARGTDGRTYPWGEEAPPTNRAAGWMPASHASPFGLLGMSGTIWQWYQNAWNAEMSPDPTMPAASSVAAAGTSSPSTAARPTGTGTRRATGTGSSGSGPPGERPDPTASYVAAAGPTEPSTAALPSGARTRQASGTISSASGPSGECSDPTMPASSDGADAGSTAPSSAARPSGSGTRRATGAGTSGSVPPGECSDPTRPPAVADAGSIAPRTAARPTGTGARRASGAGASASVPPGECSDPTMPASSDGAEAGATTTSTAAPTTASGAVLATGTRASASGPSGECSDPTMTIRGGSWNVYVRYRYSSHYRDSYLGLRPAR